MTDLQEFKKDGKTIRTIEIHGEPGFIAKDVADALGYIWKGVAGTLSHVPEEWRGVCPVQTPSGEQEMVYLTEPGLFFFLNRSDKPGALPFQKFVAGEVLPAIRKTGSYSAPKGEHLIALAVIEAQRLIAELKPKADYFDTVTGAKGAIRMGEVAKIIDVPGIGRNHLFAFLREKGVLMQDNLPYQKYIDLQWFRVVQSQYTTADGEIRITHTTLAYQRGINAIINLLQKEGYRPRRKELTA